MIVQRPGHPSLMSGVLTGGRTDDVVAAWRCFGAVQAATVWPEDVLFERLGCQIPSPKETTPEAQARHSVRYLSWLIELCALVDRVEDKRAVVTGAFRLVRDAGGSSPQERLDRAIAALARVPTGRGEQNQLEGRDLLEIGEIAAAWRTAAHQLGHGEAYERGRRLDALDGGPNVGGAHVDRRRMQALLGDDSFDAIGPNVARAIHVHCAACPACASLRAEVSPTPTNGPAHHPDRVIRLVA